MISIFIKGCKKDPLNYREITLLRSALKILTGILTKKSNSVKIVSEEQQGFRSKNNSGRHLRPTTD